MPLPTAIPPPGVRPQGRPPHPAPAGRWPPSSVGARALAAQTERARRPAVPGWPSSRPGTGPSTCTAEAMIGHALRQRGADVSFMTCGGGLEICDRVNTWEAPPMPCTLLHPVRRGLAGRPRLRPHHAALRVGGRPTTTAGPSSTPSPSTDMRRRQGPERRPARRVDGDPGQVVPHAHRPRATSRWPRPTWRSFLRSARRIERGVEAALDRLQPDVVMLLNGLFLFEAVAWEVCRRRGIDVVTYERGMIKDTLVFERNARRPACSTSSAQWATRRTPAARRRPRRPASTSTSTIVVTVAAPSTSSGAMPASRTPRPPRCRPPGRPCSPISPGTRR